MIYESFIELLREGVEGKKFILLSGSSATSNCEAPFVFASKDKELLDELREFLNSLSEEEIEKIQFYSNSDKKGLYLSHFVPYSHYGIDIFLNFYLIYTHKNNNITHGSIIKKDHKVLFS